jgi:cobalt-zinc-cadmium efflux system protein
MRAQGRLVVALLLTGAVAIVEFWGGYLSHSLALTTDAIHVSTDVVALGLALIAAIGASRPADVRRTFGYGRIEVLGALVNGTLLLVATIVILYEAAKRFGAPSEPHGTLMTIFAAGGLAINLIVARTLTHGGDHGHDHGHDHDHGPDLNVRAALFHVIGDALGAVAVIIGGVVIALTGLTWIDPTISVLVALLIVAGVFRLMRDATDVLLESVPAGVRIDDVAKAIGGIAGVAGVHDLHVWSIGSGSRALSAHVQLDDRRISEATEVLREIDRQARDGFAIDHTTIQFECEECGPYEAAVCIRAPR